jgi:hypothetical protein
MKDIQKNILEINLYHEKDMIELHSGSIRQLRLLIVYLLVNFLFVYQSGALGGFSWFNKVCLIIVGANILFCFNYYLKLISKRRKHLKRYHAFILGKNLWT